MKNNRITLKQALGMWLLGMKMPKNTKSISSSWFVPTWQEKQPIWTDWSTEKAIQEGFKASTWVYACVFRIQKAVASVPWIVSRENKPGEWEQVPGHPLEKLLDKPNPFMDRQSFMERVVAQLYLGGNAIISKVRAGNGAVVELWPLPPDKVKPVPDRENFISHYEDMQDLDGRRLQISPEDIIHLMFVDPANPYWGLSPLQVAAKVVDTDVEAVTWNKVSLQNRCVADGVFAFKEPLTEEQWEEARRQIREQHQGAGNARTPWVIGGDAQWYQLSLTPAEMDFIESRKMTREEICAVFNVPPPMVGIYDNATLANIETSRKIFWLDTIIPLLEDIQSALNRALTPEFGQGLWLEFDLSNIKALQESMKDKVDMAKTLWSMGVPFNDINQRLELGFDNIPGGDIGYLPMSLLPSTNLPSKEREVSEEGEDEKEAKKEHKAWRLNSEEQKTIYWKMFDGRRRRWEGKAKGLVEQRFKDEGRIIADAYKQKRDIELVLNQQKEKWMSLIKSVYVGVMEDFAQQTLEQLGKAAGVPFKKEDYNPWMDVAQDWLDYVVNFTVEQITGTNLKQINSLIKYGMALGQSIDEIAEEIMQMYSDFGEFRAFTIARTSVVSASNAGSHFAALGTGLSYKRVWLSSRDDRVRDDHAEMDGQIREKNEPFEAPDGSLLMFPEDVSLGASAAQTIQCRCVETFELL